MQNQNKNKMAGAKSSDGFFKLQPFLFQCTVDNLQSATQTEMEKNGARWQTEGNEKLSKSYDTSLIESQNEPLPGSLRMGYQEQCIKHSRFLGPIVKGLLNYCE